MNYLNSTKNLFNSILFIFPFIILYELIAFFKFKNMPYQIRNTADIIIRDVISYFSPDVMTFYSLFLFFFLFLYILYNYKLKKTYTFNLNYTLTMYVEGIIWGTILVFIINGKSLFVSSFTMNSDYLLSFYYCIGASIWEEVLFRLICISIFLYIFAKIKINKNVNIIMSIIVSSVLFSMFHYIGSMGDVFSLYTFFYRFVGGIYLSILYYYRGIGISMMSHFVYDFILVTVPFY